MVGITFPAIYTDRWVLHRGSLYRIAGMDMNCPKQVPLHCSYANYDLRPPEYAQ